MSRYKQDIRELGKQVIYNNQQWILRDPPTLQDVKDTLKNWYPDAWQTTKTGDPDEVAKRAGKTEKQVFADLAPEVVKLLAEADEIRRVFTAEFGFDYVGTGGGCDAFLFNLPGDADDPPHFMVTDEDASVPLYWDQDATFGYYPAYGEDGEYKFITTRQIVDGLRAGTIHPKWRAPAPKPPPFTAAPADVAVVNQHRRALGQAPLNPTAGWTAKEIADMAENIRRHGRTHNPRRLKRRLLR